MSWRQESAIFSDIIPMSPSKVPGPRAVGIAGRPLPPLTPAPTPTRARAAAAKGMSWSCSDRESAVDCSTSIADLPTRSPSPGASLEGDEEPDSRSQSFERVFRVNIEGPCDSESPGEDVQSNRSGLFGASASASSSSSFTMFMRDRSSLDGHVGSSISSSLPPSLAASRPTSALAVAGKPLLEGTAGGGVSAPQPPSQSRSSSRPKSSSFRRHFLQKAMVTRLQNQIRNKETFQAFRARSVAPLEVTSFAQWALEDVRPPSAPRSARAGLPFGGLSDTKAQGNTVEALRSATREMLRARPQSVEARRQAARRDALMLLDTGRPRGTSAMYSA